MDAEIIKFPGASRGANARKPRRSKNGAPEVRTAKAAPLEAPAKVVSMSDIREGRVQRLMAASFASVHYVTLSPRSHLVQR
jgi:hypothetical protein